MTERLCLSQSFVWSPRELPRCLEIGVNAAYTTLCQSKHSDVSGRHDESLQDPFTSRLAVESQTAYIRPLK